MKVAVLGGSEGSRSSAEAAASALKEAGHDVRLVPLEGDAASQLATWRPDAVFDAIEDGRSYDGDAMVLAGLFDAVCVGSDEHACRLANDGSLLPGVMDAFRMSFGADITASWLAGICISRPAFMQWGLDGFLDRIADRALGFPLCVKPARGGSAKRADDVESLRSALEGALEVCPEAVVRQWVEGVELRACVLGSGWDAYTLPLVEVSCEGDAVRFSAPVRLDSLSPSESDAQAIIFEIERAALEAYQAFGMRDYGVIDMAWDGGQARILGIQTHPSMAQDREFQAACAAAGLSMPAVLDALVGQYE